MKKLLLILSILSIICFGCEELIDIETPNAPTQIQVDGFINNQYRAQEIKLTYTREYFSDEPLTPVLGANVTLTNNVTGDVLNFTDEDANGVYTWLPPTANDTLVIRQRGDDNNRNQDGLYNNYYRLDVSAPLGSEMINFYSTTSIERVPVIDSISATFRPQGLFSTYDLIYTQIWANDFVGAGDCYWIKTWKNGKFLGRANELNICYDINPDRSNIGETLTEPTPFIPPVRTAINPALTGDEFEEELPVYEVGDTVYCEIHSITESTFDFWSISKEQMLNGGLFATPLANAPTNIFPTDDNSDGKVTGVFSGSSINTLEFIVPEDPPVETF